MCPAEQRSSRPARRKARKRALDILFESEQRGLAVGATLAAHRAGGDPPVNPYTVTLVEGVAARQDELDELIASYSREWTLERMPAVDRTVLRLAALEICWVDDVPTAVAISEAVELTRELSTDESPAFVNGVLAAIANARIAEASGRAP